MTDKLREEIQTLRALLREVEWGREGVLGTRCRVCGGPRFAYVPNGGMGEIAEVRRHAPDCKLAAALGGMPDRS